MSDSLEYNGISGWSVGVNSEQPIDGSDEKYDTTWEIHEAFEEWVEDNPGKDAQDVALLIFDESDGDYGGGEMNGVAVAKGSQLANVSKYDPPRWVEIDSGTGRMEGDAYHTTMQESGHGIGLCGGCYSESHGCGMNYDDTYTFDGSENYPGGSNEFCRTAMECPDDGGPNHCGTYGVDVKEEGPFDKEWADGYYWDDCAGACLRQQW